MVKLAICDDDLEMGKIVGNQVDQWMTKHKIAYDKQVFSSSKGLLYEIEDGTEYDVLLLDIEMPELDGIKLTEQIKIYLPNVLIIFITSHEKYVYESFKVQPFRYVTKKYLPQMIPYAMRDATDFLMKSRDKYLYVENQDGMEKILTQNIAYIYHRGKYAYIKKMNGLESKVRKTLKQVYSELPLEDFVWLDRGCICNLLQISRISGGDVLLEDGTRLQVSRDRLTEVKSFLRRYWIGTEEE